MSRPVTKKSMVALMSSIGALTVIICCYVPLVFFARNNPFIMSLALATMVILVLVNGICIGILLRARKAAASQMQ